ncbi:MAG: endoribonuclease YicC domain-containing protein, partial [Roseateles sp.]
MSRKAAAPSRPLLQTAMAVLGGLVSHIERLTAQAGQEAAAQPLVIKERFARRMAELVGEAASEERIVQEAAAQAVKADVREELDRLASHV